MTLRHKIGHVEKLWCRALLFNIIYLCSKFEGLMSKGYLSYGQDKTLLFFLNLTLSKDNSQVQILNNITPQCIIIVLKFEVLLSRYIREISNEVFFSKLTLNKKNIRFRSKTLVWLS